MPLTSGPNLGLLVNGDQGEPHYAELMRQWRGFDVLVQCTVLDRDLTAPPSSPTNGAAYIVNIGPTGAWATHALKIARWSSVANAWEFYQPQAGWRAHVVDEQVTLTYVDGQWQQRESPMLLGINNVSGASYTFTLTDGRNRVVRLSHPTNITATVPWMSSVGLPIGSVITVRQVGAGQVILTPETGSVILNLPAGTQARTARQGATVMLYKVAVDTWDVTGDLAPE